MQIYKKVLIVLSILIVALFILSNTVFGTLIDEFDNSITISDTDELATQGGKIVGIIQVIGTIVAVGMITVLGIKYMLGSAEQRAEYKKSMIPYLVGAILIFGFSNITQIIYEWASKL